MTTEVTPDVQTLRSEVQLKYTEVAENPELSFHFHHGRPLAEILGYPMEQVDAMPPEAVESFAGVGNPFSLGDIQAGEVVLDLGSGAGFDCFVAAAQVGQSGQVVGIDMTQEMLAKSRATARAMGADNIEFREGLIEDMPVADGWADVVISNGVINLCADKKQVFGEIMRVLRPGGTLQFADIANGKPVPASAIANIDLWTSWIAGGLPCAGWRKMMEEMGFADIEIGPPVDTFAGAGGEKKARAFEVFGYAFRALKPA